MRDVSSKIHSLRIARAETRLQATRATLDRIQRGDLPKGDSLPVAKVAAIQAAKNTSQIIPYCHPLPIDYAGVEYRFDEAELVITVTVKAIYKTGVEIEALTAASVAALTIYDMVKMIDEEVEIGTTRLISKQGGKNDWGHARPQDIRFAVVVASDSVSRGEAQDRSGARLVERLEHMGLTKFDFCVLADDEQLLHDRLTTYVQEKLDLVITTGGTGLGPRDVTTEAALRLIDRPVPGVEEAIRAHGQQRFPLAMLSRSVAGLCDKTMLLCLPGSTSGVDDALDAVFPALLHVFKILQGAGHDPNPTTAP